MDILRFIRHAHFSAGEITRIRQMLRPSGNTLILPYDQFIEHDCRHLDADSDSGNPDYIMELAVEGGYNGVAVHYGISNRFWSKTEGKVPLIVKINGKTSIPSEKLALSVPTSFVEDAVKLGATGIGYTMYYGTPSQDRDLPQLAGIRKECEKYGMPLIVWAYPRGEAIDVKGGRSTSYALESAARLAMEMGATIIKSNLPSNPKADFNSLEGVPKYYKEFEEWIKTIDPRKAKIERAKRIVRAVHGIPILFSGGSEISDNDLLDNASICLEGGCFGFIFGRNMWKREKKHALDITIKLQKLLDDSIKYPMVVDSKEPINYWKKPK
jgi:fructose-bisphosphate aldolase, class I